MKWILGCVLLSIVAVTPVSAAGFNLAWDQCLNGGGNESRSFACNSNSTTPQYLFLSVTAPSGIGRWVSFEWELLIQSEASSLPPWWHLRGSGQCRNGALTVAATGNVSGCTDVYAGNGGGGIGAYNVGYDGANQGRLLGVWAVPMEFQTALSAGEEYFVTRIGITYAKTVNSDCSGCMSRACIVGARVKIVQLAGSPGGNATITSAAQRGHVVWQSSSEPDACAGQATTKNVTWGKLKKIYR